MLRTPLLAGLGVGLLGEGGLFLGAGEGTTPFLQDGVGLAVVVGEPLAAGFVGVVRGFEFGARARAEKGGFEDFELGGRWGGGFAASSALSMISRSRASPAMVMEKVGVAGVVGGDVFSL